MTFKITVQPSGHVFDIEAGDFILDAALRHGLNFPYGCRSGGCGACVGTLLEGKIDYPNGTPCGLTEEQMSKKQTLFCQAKARSDLTIEVKEVVGADGIEIKKLPARVVTLKKLCHDVMLMELKLPISQRLQFLAGQYIDILLKDGRRRAFSLANAPHDDEVLQLHIRKVEGGFFTGQVFEEMQEKALVRIEGPLGSFFLREESNRPIILIAGGTGFAPVKAMVEHAIASEVRRPIHVYWGAKAERDLYLDELARYWAIDNDHISYTAVLSEPEETDNWQGRTGWVHAAVAEDFPDLSGFDVYLCGPPQMIDAAKTQFTQQGLPDEQLYSDSFEYSSD